jgi:cytidylate kinase
MNISDQEKHTEDNPTTDEDVDQEKKDLIELWKSGDVIVIEDDGEID